MRRRTVDEVQAAGDLRWFAPALDRLRSLRGESDPSLATFLALDQPMHVARAPGRLDVMGGIADYSGSLVLEMPLGCATVAVAQTQLDCRLDVVSFRDGRPFRFGIELDEILAGALSDPGALARWFRQRPTDSWAAYVAGSVSRCLTLAGITRPSHGLRLLLVSDVPEGKGVSSSAALEVAAMASTAACYDVPLDASELAAACQWAENHIAGAPCGIMDQMASALGRRDRLLRLRCQPATVEGHVAIPAGCRFYGIDSGLRHAVTGADYGTVRTAAFMGYRIIADLAGLPVTRDGPMVRVEDDRWGGYLANIGSREFTARFASRLPEQMRGAEFLARYAGITDVVTRVQAGRWYPVRQATAHPVHEHERVVQFAAILESGLDSPTALSRMGELMLESHASYGACGLGSDGTDLLVELATVAGADRGVYGAKITGGGSGGTVAILGSGSAHATVLDIARAYERETGRSAIVFDGSGPGAEELGVIGVRPEFHRLSARGI